MAHTRSEESIPWWSSSSKLSCDTSASHYTSSPPLPQTHYHGASLGGVKNGRSDNTNSVDYNNVATTRKSDTGTGKSVRKIANSGKTNNGVRGISTMMMNGNNAYDDEEESDPYDYDESQFAG